MTPREYTEILFNSALSPLQKLLYCYLRSCMDWGSGIVGDVDKKMISYQSIREHLEYLPPPGSRADGIKLGKHQVKRLLASLVTAGYLERLPGQRYGLELRFFLPLAKTGLIRSQEVRHMSATQERHTSAQPQQGFREYERHTQNGEERHTSINITLSHNNYIQYTPDADDWAWIEYTLGRDVFEGDVINVALETEKFNLRAAENPEFNMAHQRGRWRIFMIRAVEFYRAKAG